MSCICADAESASPTNRVTSVVPRSQRVVRLGECGLQALVKKLPQKRRPVSARRRTAPAVATSSRSSRNGSENWRPSTPGGLARALRDVRRLKDELAHHRSALRRHVDERPPEAGHRIRRCRLRHVHRSSEETLDVGGAARARNEPAEGEKADGGAAVCIPLGDPLVQERSEARRLANRSGSGMLTSVCAPSVDVP